VSSTTSVIHCIRHNRFRWSSSKGWWLGTTSTDKTWSEVSCQLNWSLMNWRERETLVHIFNWSIKIFSFSLWSIIIVFAIHYLEIILELCFHNFCHESLWRLRINWLSSLPVKPINEIKIEGPNSKTYFAFLSKKLWSLMPFEGVL
jgi:hypothetical protein